MAEYDVDEILKNIFDSKDSKWKPADKIPQITKEIEQLKSDMKIFLSNSDYDIVSILKESEELCVESKCLVDDMNTCKLEIEQETMAEILQSIENYNLIAKELQAVQFASNITHAASKCGNYVKQFDVGRDEQSFTKAIEAVYDLVQYLEMPAEGFKQLDLHANTKQLAELILNGLVSDLMNEWSHLISWTVEPGNQRTVATISLNFDQSLECIDVLNGLVICKKINEKVSEFGQFLLKDVVGPIIHNDCTVYAEVDELITVTATHKENYKPPYSAVLTNLRLLFHSLSNKLKVKFMGNTTIMQLMGQDFGIAFRDVVVKDCLIDTIPNNIQDLQTYGRITSEIVHFEEFMKRVEFFNGEYSLLQYVDNIDVLFSNKSSQYFLETARNLMLKDLSMTMSIGVESIPEDKTNISLDENEALSILDKIIPKSLFYFPRCMISKSAQELLDLAYVLMEQAVQCSDVVSKRLYNTTRLIFELYDAVVPYHHENYLHTIPQYVALFHNNCMYLAHNLQTFGDKWLILMEGRELDYPISFVDLVQKLRDLGYKYLTIHMQQQRKQILDNIRSSDLNCIVTKDVLSENAEAAIRQCLRQLHLLKNVWIGVFPSNVFIRLMATLVNMFIDELIHRVCTVEDISMDMATQLTDMYQLVVVKAPQLFQNSTDIETHVESWVKLQELIFVLGGSLKDIENHWKDGTGPLAIHFRTEELRNLIKALFQNTQIRANLLSKIK